MAYNMEYMIIQRKGEKAVGACWGYVVCRFGLILTVRSEQKKGGCYCYCMMQHHQLSTRNCRWQFLEWLVTSLVYLHLHGSYIQVLLPSKRQPP